MSCWGYMEADNNVAFLYEVGEAVRKRNGNCYTYTRYYVSRRYLGYFACSFVSYKFCVIFHFQIPYERIDRLSAYFTNDLFSCTWSIDGTTIIAKWINILRKMDLRAELINRQFCFPWIFRKKQALDASLRWFPVKRGSSTRVIRLNELYVGHGTMVFPA